MGNGHGVHWDWNSVKATWPILVFLVGLAIAAGAQSFQVRHNAAAIRTSVAINDRILERMNRHEIDGGHASIEYRLQRIEADLSDLKRDMRRIITGGQIRPAES